MKVACGGANKTGNSVTVKGDIKFGDKSDSIAACERAWTC